MDTTVRETTVGATVDTSPPVYRLTGSKDGLDVTVDVRPPEPAAADILTLLITARDADGGAIDISVAWEPDRGGTTQTDIDCDRGPHPTTPSEETVERRFAFRHPGVAAISVTVSTAYCAGSGLDRKALKVAGKVVVGPGPLLSNGPLPIDLKAWVGDASTETTTVVAMYAYEVDGFIHRVEVDWGDGSPGEAVSTPLGQCDDPLHTWPGPSRFNRGFAHDYPPGAYTARVTVRSSGCDGRNEQVRTVDVAIT